MNAIVHMSISLTDSLSIKLSEYEHKYDYVFIVNLCEGMSVNLCIVIIVCVV